jgi:putative tryptophan/tyrosine transport system substrate-binding protein
MPPIKPAWHCVLRNGSRLREGLKREQRLSNLAAETVQPSQKCRWNRHRITRGTIQNNSGLPQGPGRPAGGRLRVRRTDCEGEAPVSGMRRREFITLLGGAAAWPLAAQSQEAGRVYRLGAMIPVGRETPAIVAFFDEMRFFGFVEGKNLAVLPNGFGVRNDELAERAKALVDAAPDVIMSGPDNYTRVLQQATRTIPLVAMTEDMVRAGFVDSLARPSSNITGISLLSPELDGKRQEILVEAVPTARKMAALADSTVTPQGHLDSLQDAARGRGVELLVFGVARRDDIATAINAAKAGGAQAINLLASPLFTVDPRDLIGRIASLRLPAMHQWPEIAEEGGLMGYGPRFTQVFRQRARQVARILRGAKPSDIPVEQPTHFELVVNVKTAQSIGHEIPAALVLRADKVIE